ncbi:MAG: CDP-alcohol phosphatidyltransferase family protein [Bacteroidales bacterium]|nr:CDP-alcohol phosphatidyltransferase family protein [Bacteroidales bacterium]MBR6929368.1 CDP-alcohol phosphatidyltransferase family protein [Bacteroidales bacterium]
MEEEKKQSKRIQTSLLSAAEKKVLIKIANRLPRWTNSDQLTFIGFLGAVIIALGFIFANLNAQFLWLSILGFVINWYGDSLDGTLARVRNEQRPVYGFYIDHTMDAVNELIMFLGAGMSPYMRFDLACILLIFYLMLTLNVAMNTHLRGEFCLTYGKLGPTEFRFVCIVACLLLIAVKPLQTFSFTIPWIDGVLPLGALDIVGGVILVALIVIYFLTIAQDAKYYSKIDPKHKHD